MVHYYCNKEEIENNALSRILDAESLFDNICVFPDIHYCSEKAIPVGVSFSSTDKFFPLVTGKDVGCGVMFLRFPTKAWKKPFNKSIHYNAFNKASQTFTDDGLGGGNHFLSIEDGNDGNTYIICHTGTRNLGIYMYQHLLGLVNEFNYKEDVNGTSLPKDYWTEELSKKYKDVLNSGFGRRTQFVTKTFKFLNLNGYINNVQYEIIDSVHNVFEFNNNIFVHRKGATELYQSEVAIPLSMTRGTLIIKPKKGFDMKDNLWSCAHGAGRQLSRTDTLKHWHSMKKKDKKSYEEKFCELLDRSGKFSSGLIQEFDFAYKSSDNMLSDQPFIKEVTRTTPIVTVKFSEI
jgi:release factor H-coupled RctB family protein